MMSEVRSCLPVSRQLFKPPPATDIHHSGHLTGKGYPRDRHSGARLDLATDPRVNPGARAVEEYRVVTLDCTAHGKGGSALRDGEELMESVRP